MLETIVFETNIEPENRRKLDESEINNKVGSNDNRSTYGSVKARKNTFYRREFFTSKSRLGFMEWRQAFINILILHNFFLNWSIFIETDVSGDMIGRIFS